MLSSFGALQGPMEVSPGNVLVPGGGLVHFVHASGASGLDLLPTGMASPSPGGFFTSVNAALGSCRANRGDTIICLPGHTENLGVAAWPNMVAGVRVRGLGTNGNRPAFTWNAAGSTLPISVANFAIEGCTLYLAGQNTVNGPALTVAAPITISAAGVEINDCDVWWGFDADQIVGIGITTTAAADFMKFNRNRCYAETAAVPTTTFLRLTGTDNLEMDGTFIIGPGSTTGIGPVQMLTTASLKAKIINSQFQSTLAASTLAFTGMAGCTGQVYNCGFGVLAAGNGLTTGTGLQVNNSWTAVAGAAGVATTG